MQRIDRARADRACRADHEEWQIAKLEILCDLTAQRRRIQPLCLIGGHPADAVGSDPGQVGGLLNPGMRLDRRIHPQPRSIAREARGSNVPRGDRCAGSECADEIRHVPTAHEQPAAARRKSNQLGNPPHRLPLHLGRNRPEPPGADVLIERGRQEITEHPDRSRARSDVTEEPWMSVEHGAVEQQRCHIAQQTPGIRAG